MGAAPRFLVDGMLIRLGKYLRCLGIDAEWERGVGTRALTRRADVEDRVLLTRNTHLGSEIEPPRRWLVLASEDPVEELCEVARVFALALVVIVVTASAAGACGSLVAANGAVNLVRTSTLVAYHDGVEHYVTSFEFTGAPKTFGSIIPLPDKPTTVDGLLQAVSLMLFGSIAQCGARR